MNISTENVQYEATEHTPSLEILGRPKEGALAPLGFTILMQVLNAYGHGHGWVTRITCAARCDIVFTVASRSSGTPMRYIVGICQVYSMHM